MTSKSVPKFVILAILDGWGIAPSSPGNAITQAKTINMDKFVASYPHGQLSASGVSVGLPGDEDGNTETGHLNLGAGRIVYQDLERINMAIADGSFFDNKVLKGAFEFAKKNKSNLHIMGLIGAGGAHSNIQHLFALIQMASKEKFKNLYLHLFTDGRDSPPTAAKTYVKMVMDVIEKEKVGNIATIMGRYWAMDRDQRWDRTQNAYFALTQAKGQLVKSAFEAIEMSYNDAKTDEFLEPFIITDASGIPIAKISDNDAVIFFNFRIDRPRQLTKSFIYKDFSKAPISFEYDPYKFKYEKEHNDKKSQIQKEPFERGKPLENLYFVSMTDYGKPIKDSGAKPAFPPEVVDMPLSGVISANNLSQLKITESEKERFVGFYFNGLRDKPYPLEERVIIPSAKVPTYDQKPEMCAKEITDELLHKMQIGEYKLVVINFANPDMVGHTGNIGACVAAIELVDECIGKIANFTIAYEGALLITADHGNAEEMINPKTGEIDTEHSDYPVPFIVIFREFLGKAQILRSGILADIAPTILSFLNLPIPSGMTGSNLLSTIEVH
ncbi:phosphoglycerate mutase (2,3-diphosphoglycerate-independent) [Candidatus Woesebacteria bacterium RIFCSPHIGHO2_01_FULL_38_9b]|uniref:2,3-bisphosphoglycerate-independent phosphoglycerate mutase n=1 Tax=Candidatus Woesebacteria bacterium RIFCSPHIGHO2_01_FULL_38_9b TaxID=1802493 RepID=A0A1F7XYH4_9BACT|nr:MAG: phosphoglycerate mutase (2,3-diphosphoglycerate-independent) [Candidatus Woesebacteria bacterium RIFCSPHIGHO2_01_FULL_38_9b]